MGTADFHSPRRLRKDAIPPCGDGRCYHRWAPDPFFLVGSDRNFARDPETEDDCEVCTSCRMERRTAASGVHRYGPTWTTVRPLGISHATIGALEWRQVREIGEGRKTRSALISMDLGGPTWPMDQVRQLHTAICGQMVRDGGEIRPADVWTVFAVRHGGLGIVEHLLTVCRAV